MTFKDFIYTELRHKVLFLLEYKMSLCAVAEYISMLALIPIDRVS